MISYIGYIRNEPIILYVIVWCHDSNEKRRFEAVDNNVMEVASPALHTTERVMPMLGVERWSAR